MFELEVRDWRHIRLRIGRWHFRTWRAFTVKLPSGYVRPELAYAVEQLDADDRSVAFLGAFVSEALAHACMAQLESRGWTDLIIHPFPLYARLEEWNFDA